MKGWMKDGCESGLEDYLKQKKNSWAAMTKNTKSHIHKAHLCIWHKFWKFSLLKYTQFYCVKLQFLIFNTKPQLKQQTWNENIS